jgi:separase
LYVGHNGGQQYVRESEVEKFNSNAVALLLGCSSGHLRVEGDFGPLGISLSYLLAGSPCVVGNLWDVTDVDGDNFNVDLLSKWFENEGEVSAAHAVAEARSACKLEYIVGAAAVCYGLPVYITKEQK